MSNYQIQASPAWNLRDGLATGAPEKVISGQLFHEEFTQIAARSAEKADTNGDSDEAFLTSTAGSSSNTTLAASTEYVTSALVAYGTKTVSTEEPSGGQNGDVHYQV
jgi:hypothetical protein